MSLSIRGHHPYSLLLSALFLTMVSLAASAQSQRMFLPAQSFTISASGTGSARSMCLDFGIATPRRSTSFSPASASLTKISVSVPGRGEIPLPEAIAAKIVDVSGSGDADHLRFRNLLSTTDIKITVGSPSLMLPDDNRRSDDLAHLFQPGAVKQVDQVDLWKLRATPAMLQLGMKPGDVPRGYTLNPNWMVGTQEWVQKTMALRPSKGQFVLQRVLPIRVVGPRLDINDDAQPLYILYPGNAPPRVFKGNGELLDASAAIISLWSGTGGTPPPRVVMMGMGEDQDFDAARLTLEAAAGGGGRGNLIGPGRPSAFGFDPPDGPRPPGDDPIYEGGPWANIAVDRHSDDTYSAKSSYFKRGFVKVFARTLNLVCRMAAIVRVVESVAPKDAPADDHIAVLREAIANEVAAARKQDPKLSALEGNYPAAEITIDGKATGRQVFSDVVTIPAYPLVAQR